MKPEADLLPHLQGISAGIWIDPRQPGKPDGALLVLHIDEVQNAKRLIDDFLPRLGSFLPGRATLKKIQEPQTIPRNLLGSTAIEVKVIGIVGGHEISVFQRNRDVLIVWGSTERTTRLKTKLPANSSVSAIYNASGLQARVAPSRFGAVWPGRVGVLDSSSFFSPEVLGLIADDPPILWSGWTESDRALDHFQWSDLAGRVRRMLATIPPNPSPAR